MPKTNRQVAGDFDELADGFLRPDYGGLCFSSIPATVGSVLGVDLGTPLSEEVFDGVSAEQSESEARRGAERSDGVDASASNVLVLFVDSLGFQQFREHLDDNPLLQAFTEQGNVTPLTSVYPSETAACVTTMHTGREPVEHGLLGWNAYDADADTVYETLPYAAKDGGDLALDPDELFDGESVYQRLGAAGVDCHAVEPDYGPGYSDTALAGATEHHYETTASFALAVRDVLREADAPSYTYAYYPTVDTVSHEHGPGSEQYGMQVAEVCDALERAFATLDDETAEETLVCLVSDHGQVDVAGASIELDDTGVLEHVATDRSGAPLVLGGSRNVHLRVDDVAAARDCLVNLDALVLTRDEATSENLWGRGDPGPVFERNCGDLVVVPREGALWHAGEPEELPPGGMHGGLDPEELLVPFGAARLPELV